MSPLGAVPKKVGDGKVQTAGDSRLVHNLSYPFRGDSINAWSLDITTKLDSFEDAAKMVVRLGSGCFLTKIDVKAAYKLVPVRYEDWALLGFRWRGQYYYERTLPFGLKSSCRQWEWYSTALNWCLCVQLGTPNIKHYIDDFLLAERVLSVAKAHLAGTQARCVNIGVPIADKKTEGPTRSLCYLGVNIDTHEMTASLPEGKLRETITTLNFWVNATHASRRELEKLTGFLHWAAKVVHPGRTFLRRIVDHMTSLPTRYDRVAIPGDVHLDIRWWHENIANANGVLLLYEEQWTDSNTIELTTDACDLGYGAAYGRRWIKNQWSADEQRDARGDDPADDKSRSMPYLEFLAIVYAAATWGPLWARKRVNFRCDCMPVVQALADLQSRTRRMMRCVRALHALSVRYHFDVKCTHIAGVDNIAADALSRDEMQRYRDLYESPIEAMDTIGVLPPLF